MDEKTAELRDIFLDVADEEAVTESQAETPGTLAPDDDVEERLADAVRELREQFDLSTALSVAEHVAVVREFYAGRSDADIADSLGVSRETVVRARLDLHLSREGDVDPAVDRDAFREAVADGADPDALAERFDLAESTARRCSHAVGVHAQRRRVNDRYRDRFETILGEPELSERHTDHESGLDGATADQEVDVSF